MAEATGTPTEPTTGATQTTAATTQTGDGATGSTAASTQSTAADGKDGNGTTPAAPVVPERYDLKVPDGVTFTEPEMASFQEQAKALKLTQEQAAGVFEGRMKLRGEVLSQFGAQHEQQVTKWEADLKVDTEVGGEAFAKNAALAQQVLNKYGDPALKEALTKSGYGNYPGLVKMMVRIGKEFGEDHFENAGSGGGRPEQKSAADMLYGGTPT